jgi:chromosome partitioning protein
MSIKVAIINMKGGVGKSTLAAQLAWQFVGMRRWLKRVLVIDLDPQFNVSQYLLGVDTYENIHNSGSPTVWDIFEEFSRTPGTGASAPLDPNSVIHNVTSYQGGSRIDLIPSRLELAYTLRNPAQKESLLERLVSRIDSEYDLVLLDCPPTESMLTTAAYLTSDYILVPVRPEFLSSIGLPLLVRSMDDFHQQHSSRRLKLAGIVFNATSDYVPEEGLSKQSVMQLANQNGWYVFQSEIPFSRSYPKGAREGRPIFRTSYARSSQATRFHTFAAEFAQRIHL